MVSDVRDLRVVGRVVNSVVDGGVASRSSVTGPTAKSIRLIKIIYSVLLTKTEEKTFNLVHLAPRRAGAEVWRLLRAEYCGISAARLAAMARKLICPREAWTANATAKCDFLTSLSKRKIHATAYEVACDDNICRVRVAMLLHHVPEPVNTSLCEAHLEQQSVLSSLGSVRRDGRPSLPWQKKRRRRQKAKAKGEGKRRRPKAKAKGKGTGRRQKAKGKAKGEGDRQKQKAKAKGEGKRRRQNAMEKAKAKGEGKVRRQRQKAKGQGKKKT